MNKFFLAVGALLLSTIGAAAQPAPGSFPGCVYNSTPPSLSDKQTTALQCDSSGRIKTTGGGGGAIAFPATVSGTVTSGGIPYFNSTTQMSSSALLGSGQVVIGGGAGNPPTTSVTFSSNSTGQVTSQGLTTTSPGFYAQLTGDTVPRVRVGLNAADVASIGFGSGSATRDAFIERIAANVLGIVNSTTAQTLDIFGSRTDGSNGDWLELSKAAAGAAFIRTNKNGAGVASTLSLGTGGTNFWTVGTAGSLTTVSSGLNIGASGSATTSPASIFANTGFVGGPLAINANVTSVSGSSPLYVAVDGSTTGAQGLIGYGNNANPAGINLFKTRATTTAASTIVQNSDVLGGISFYGANGTSYARAAYIRAVVDGTPGASADMPGRLEFGVTPDGSATPATALTINNQGLTKISAGFTVGALPTPSAAGYRAYVTDQLTACAAVGTAPTGGGAVVCPVFYDGSGWISGANDNLPADALDLRHAA